jgi:cephalosporin hydroxylase
MQIRQLFEAEGTDKGVYAAAYEILLAARRKQIGRVLEIGIGTLRPGVPSSMVGFAAPHYRPGGSLRAWRAYFPNAQIVGIDVQSDTQFEEDRIETFICNSTDSAKVQQFLADQRPFDLIVDDGSHRSEDQLATLKNFFPALAVGGLYVIEDIHWQTELFSNTDRVEPLIDGAPYCINYGRDSNGPWKLIVIARLR